MSAIVVDPVDAAAGATVPASISMSLLWWSAGGDTTCLRSDCGDPGRRGSGRGLLGEVGEEQGLVDTALEDRHAQLHALLDHLATFHAGFARELRGREVNCHRTDPPVRFATFTGRYRVPRTPTTESAQGFLKLGLRPDSGCRRTRGRCRNAPRAAHRGDERRTSRSRSARPR